MCDKKEKQLELDKRYLKNGGRMGGKISYCKRRQVGALIVKDQMIISDGYNGTAIRFREMFAKTRTMLPNLTFCMRKPMPLRKVAASSTAVKVPTIYVTSAPLHSEMVPKLIIQSGIKRVVYSEKYRVEDGCNLITSRW